MDKEEAALQIEKELDELPTVVAGELGRIMAQLEEEVALEDFACFVTFIGCLIKRGYPSAFECVNHASRVLTCLEKQDRQGFLELALHLAQASPEDAGTFFTSGPDALSRIKKEQRPEFFSLAREIGQSAGQLICLLDDASQAISSLSGPLQHQMMALAAELLPLSCAATVEFLKSCPTVVGRVGPVNLDAWFREGVKALRESKEGGIAYFRVELNKSVAFLEQFSSGIELDRVKDTLATYGLALTGGSMSLFPAPTARDIGIGKAPQDGTPVNGTAIYLPGFFDRYRTREENLAWYKTALTHQAGHFEFGTFDFSLAGKPTLFEKRVPQLNPQPATEKVESDLYRFLDLFEYGTLASDLFMLLEDTRVDFLAKRTYKGLSKDYEKAEIMALRGRRPIFSQPLREAFLEVLVQLSLGSWRVFSFPAGLHSQLLHASRILRRIQSPEATVQDTAEATIRLYDILSRLPNIVVADDLKTIDLSDRTAELPLPFREEVESISPDVWGEGRKIPYSSPREIDFRGKFRPALTRQPPKVKPPDEEETGQMPQPPSGQTPQQPPIEDAELEIKSSTDETIYPEEVLLPSLMEARRHAALVKEDDQGKPLETDFSSFFYDEWDFRANDYRLRWCRLKQSAMSEGTPEFFEATLEEHAALAAEIKKQFEQVSPQGLRKIKRLPDGEEFDLDAVIDFVGERKAGQCPVAKVYSRRNKTERDVSVVFLLDMSSSTIEYIDQRMADFQVRRFARDYKGYLDWLQAQQAGARPMKRIIDLEKEATVLLIRALEIIGDTYAIYGFSGHGREHVEFYVIKNFQEVFSERTKARIDGISPMRGTRMGPAIRHAACQLERQPSKSKFLFLISDGRPEDEGYGRDGLDTDYAINDTRMALLEAKQKTIVPFCLTVDRSGHDYLKAMCGDMDYEVVADIEALPKRLPALYRRLTV